jgi:hypothetical protein
VRTYRPLPPALDVRLLAHGLGFGLLCGAGLLAVLATEGPARWPGAALYLYAGMELVDAGFRLPLRLAGVTLRPLQDAPRRSRSLGEFWGQRWNREIGGLLHRWCFRPLARRRHASVGVVWTFFCSGLLHALGVYAAVGLRDALLVQAFFVLHGGGLLLERALRIPRWPPWAGRLWVWGFFALTAPLFLEPALKIALPSWAVRP